MRKNLTIMAALAVGAISLVACALTWMQMLRQERAANVLAAQWSNLSSEDRVAREGEEAAIELTAWDNDLSLARRGAEVAELALRTFDDDSRHGRVAIPGGEPSPEETRSDLTQTLDAARRDIAENEEQREAIVRRLNAIAALDETTALARFWSDVYGAAVANRISRAHLANLLGEPAEYWAGFDRHGAAFVVLDTSPGGSSLREAALLGATLVARDCKEGAPSALQQVFGLNESRWQRTDRLENERGNREIENRQ